MVLVISLRRCRFSYFCPEFKKWCRGDRSHASSVPVTRRRPVVVSAMEVSGTSGALHYATGDEVVDVVPRKVIAPGACHRIWWCVVLVFLKVLPQVI
jgi:hypothetical protein